MRLMMHEVSVLDPEVLVREAQSCVRKSSLGDPGRIFQDRDVLERRVSITRSLCSQLIIQRVCRFSLIAVSNLAHIHTIHPIMYPLLYRGNYTRSRQILEKKSCIKTRSGLTHEF